MPNLASDHDAANSAAGAEGKTPAQRPLRYTEGRERDANSTKRNNTLGLGRFGVGPS